VHYTMGGLWVDYNLQSTIPGLFVLGEANFSDHGANRLGASALMQGLADGYFVISATLPNYLASTKLGKVTTDHPAFQDAVQASQKATQRLIALKGEKTVDDIHRALGKIMWDKCGMSRHEQGLKEALKEIVTLREHFWNNVRLPGVANELNQELEKAGRVGDFLELAQLMVQDALERNESCGGHFRTEYQTPDHEALRDDQNFCHVAAWEYQGPEQQPVRHVEPLAFENTHLSQRSYK